MSYSLHGESITNTFNLNGKVHNFQNDNANLNIEKLKREIIRQYMMPFYGSDWDMLSKNLLFIRKYAMKINYYANLYKMSDLLLYSDLLSVLEKFMESNKSVQNMEQKLYTTEQKDIIKMMFKTSAIKLLPEYEIYNAIFGKPNRRDNEKYDSLVIKKIKKLYQQPGMTFERIEQYMNM